MMSVNVRVVLLACALRALCVKGQQASSCPGSAGGFKEAQHNFVLDTEDAVRSGASYLSSPPVRGVQECVAACCGLAPRCNLALVETTNHTAAGSGGETPSYTCFLFNCVHQQRYACRFVNKVGFVNYILQSVYEKYLKGPEGLSGDKAPPRAIAGRDRVVQPGGQVILNGIESHAVGEGSISSYHWSLLEGDSSVLMEKTELLDQLRVSNLLPGRYVFQLQVSDSNQLSDTAKVTVLVLSPEQSLLHCVAAMQVGPCRAAFVRWHYNVTSERCEQFIYGGCKGNLNNYLTETQCSAACHGLPAPSDARSSLPLTGELCGAACQPGQFVCGSGCCLQRGLECDGVAQCHDASDENNCDKINRTFSRLLDIDVNQKRARCTEPPRTGPCRASHTRWYYDPLDQECHRFTYGGCDGNDNNFDQEDVCMSTCRGVTERHVFARGMFERFEEEEETESGSIAVAVVLSVAILAVVAVLSYCFIRSRRDRSRHQPVATGIPHTPFSDDSSVYASTTKPV